jgi:hypothetical protein
MEPQSGTGGVMDPEPDQPRMFGDHLESVRLPWKWVTERLIKARNYWIASTRPNGQPHSRPVWGVWLDKAFYFSTGSLAAQNLVVNPAITVHLESGSEVVIIEGVCEQVTDSSLLERVIRIYSAKYHWDIEPGNGSEPFYVVRPQVAFGWVSDESGFDGGSAFHGTATRWRFGSPQASTSS